MAYKYLSHFPERNGGAIDGLLSIQAALSYADGVEPYFLVVDKEFQYGNNLDNSGGENIEKPIAIPSKTRLFIDYDMHHNLNHTARGLLDTGYLVDWQNGERREDIQIYFRGGRIVFAPRTFSFERKGLIIGHTDNYIVENAATAGNDFGSYNLQVRNSSHGIWKGGNVLAGDDVGEDGIHFSLTCRDNIIIGMNIESGDDTVSFTQENTGSAGHIQENNQVIGCNLKTHNHSVLKMLIDDQAVNSHIRNNTVKDCIGSILGDNGQGSLAVIETPDTFDGSTISYNKISMNLDGLGGAGSVRVDGSIQGLRNNSFNGTTIKNSVGRAFYVKNAGPVEWNTGGIKNAYVPPAELTGLEVTDITHISGSTVRLQLNTTEDVSSYATATNRFATISGAALDENNGIFFVKDADDVNKTLDVSMQLDRTDSSDEAGIAATLSIGERKFAAIECLGGQGHKFLHLDIDSPAQSAIRLSNDVDNVEIGFNTISGVECLYGIDIYRATNTDIHDNKAQGNNALAFIREDNVSSNSGNRVYDNFCDGSFDTSYFMTRAEHSNNQGSNSDFISGIATIPNGQNTVSIPLPHSVYGVYSSNDMLPQDISLHPTEALDEYWGCDVVGRDYVITTRSSVDGDKNFAFKIGK